MPYTPNPETVTEPLDGEKASTAAAEFRALKTYIRDRLLAKTPSGNVGIGGAADDAYRLTIVGTDADYPGINAYNAGVVFRALALSTGAVIGTYSNSALSFVTNSLAVGGFATNGDFSVLRSDNTRDGFTVLPQSAGTGIITAARNPAFGAYVPWVFDASRYDFRVGGGVVCQIGTGGELRLGRGGAVAGTQTFYPPNATTWFHIQNPGADYLEFSAGTTAGFTNLARLFGNGSLTVAGAVTASSFVGALAGNATSATTAGSANSATVAGSANTAAEAPWAGITGKPSVVTNLAAGTYTPTVTNIANASGSADVCMYSRVGNIVTVTGTVDITAAAAGATAWRISLPIPSTFTQQNDARGVLGFAGTTFDRSNLVQAFLGSGGTTIEMNANAVSASFTTVSFTLQYEVK